MKSYKKKYVLIYSCSTSFTEHCYHYFIEVWLIYSIVLVSGVQPSHSDFFFQILFHYRLYKILNIVPRAMQQDLVVHLFYMQQWISVNLMGFPGDSVVKNPPAMQETQVQCLGREDPLEQEIATHCGVLAREIPWTEESGGLQSMRLQRVRHHLVTQPQSVNPILLIDLSLTLSPLIATSLFSMSVNLFLFCK